jgi:hypothetical protein
VGSGEGLYEANLTPAQCNAEKPRRTQDLHNVRIIALKQALWSEKRWQNAQLTPNAFFKLCVEYISNVQEYKPELQSQHGRYQVSKVQASLSYGNTLSLYPELLNEKGILLVRKIIDPRMMGGI